MYEITSSIGTGPFELAGVAEASFQSFYDAFGAGGALVHYEASSRGKNEWEIGVGTLSVAVDGTVSLSRDTILRSSNAGAIVAFTSGIKDIRPPWPVSLSALLNDSMQANNNLSDVTDPAVARANLGIVFPGLVPIPTLPLPWASAVPVDQHELRTVDLGQVRLLMQSKTTRTTGATITAAEYDEWILLGQFGLMPYDASVPFPAGYEMREGGHSWRRVVAGLNRPLFDATEQASWQLLSPSSSSLATWTASGPIRANELIRVTISGVSVMLRSLSTRTTGAALNAAELANYEYVSQTFNPDFIPSLAVPLGYKIFTLGETYTRLVTGTSGLAFDATERLLWVAGTIPSLSGSGTTITPAAVPEITQTTHGFAVGAITAVRLSGVAYVKAFADSEANADVVGLVIASDADKFKLYTDLLAGATGLVPGGRYYLSGTVAGQLTLTQPTNGNLVKPLLVAATATSGYVINQRILRSGDIGDKWQDLAAAPAAAVGPGGYVLDASGGPFNVPLSGVVGEWEFSDPYRTLRLNPVSIGSVGDLLERSGASLPGPFLLNVDDMYIRVVKTVAAGTVYQIADLDPDVDSIQSLTATGTVTRWGTYVELNAAALAVVTLPVADLANAGQRITLSNIGAAVCDVAVSAGTLVGNIRIDPGSVQDYVVTGAGLVYAVMQSTPVRLETQTATATAGSWNSVVLLSSAVAATISLPVPAAGDIGKTITLRNSGSGVWTPATAAASVGLRAINPGESLTILASAVATVMTISESKWLTVQSFTATGTVTRWDSIVTVNAAAAAMITLPDVASGDVRRSITVKNAGTDVVDFAISAGTLTGDLRLDPGDSIVFVATATATATGMLDTAETLRVVALTATGSCVGWNAAVTMNAAAATTLTVTAPTLGDVGKQIVVKNIGTASVTIAATAGVIAGSAVLAPGESQTLIATAASVIHTVGLTAGGYAGTWTASTQYSTGATVLHLGRLLRKIASGSSTATFDATEGSLWVLLAAPPARDWVASKYYYANEQAVTTEQLILVRVADGLSEATFSNTEAATWTSINAKVAIWTPSTYYYAYQAVFHLNRLLRHVSTNGVSGATFDGTEAGSWGFVSQKNVTAYAVGRHYYLDESTNYNGALLVRTAAGGISAAMDAVEAAKWTISTTETPTAWTAGTYYFAGQQVTHLGRVLSRVTSGMSTATFDATEGVLWSAVELPPARAWAASKYYYADEQAVSSAGVVLSRTAGGLSGATLDNTELALWTSVSGSVPTWTASTYYFQNQVVSYLGKILQKTAASGVSGATFDATEGVKWTLLSTPPARSWAATTYYYANEQVRDTNGLLIERTAAGISGAAFDATEAALWTTCFDSYKLWAATDYVYQYQVVRQGSRLLQRTAVSGVAAATFDATEGAKYRFLASQSVAAYSAAQYYYVGEQAYHLGRLLTRATAGLTSTAMDGTEAANWTAEDAQTPKPFAASSYYFAGQLMTNLGHIWSRGAAGVSGATFDLTEVAMWTRITGDNVTSSWAATAIIEADEIKATTIASASCMLRCSTQHYSAATVTQAELNNFTVVSQLSPGTWAAATPIIAGVLLLEDGVTYKRTTVGPTGAAFNAVERANYSIVSSTTKIESFTAAGTAVRFDGYATCNPVAAMTLTLPGQISSDIGRKYTVNNISASDVTVAVTVGTIVADSVVKPYSVRTFIVTSATAIALAEAYKPAPSLKTVSADYTALVTDDVLLVDTTAGSVIITLPTTFNASKQITVHKLVAANVLTVSSDTASTQVSTAGAVVSTESFTIRFTNLPMFWTGTFWTFYA